MAKQEALSILTTDEGKAMLAERYAGVIENLTKGLVSALFKNTDLSGDPDSGSVVAKRYANAKSKKYGTARTAGKGEGIKEDEVIVYIDQDEEIVEELAQKDVSLGTVKDLVNRRTANHVTTMLVTLDRKFFEVAAAAGTAVDVSTYDTIADKLEALIQECENTKNDFVDGVDRIQMGLVLSTGYYGKVRNDLDKQVRSNIDTAAEEFYAWHGVETVSCVRLPADVEAILMVRGAVAQPVLSNGYGAEKIPLSEDYGLELFYHFGTKAVTPDLIFVIKKAGATTGAEEGTAQA